MVAFLAPKVWFWLPFGSAKHLLIESKREKYVVAKQHIFLHWFVHALGMDFVRFFHDLFTCKRRRHMKNDLAKKLMKHLPLRQNQGRFFLIKNIYEQIIKKHTFCTPRFITLLGTILEGFGRSKILVFFNIFLHFFVWGLWWCWLSSISSASLSSITCHSHFPSSLMVSLCALLR